ncbi:MAG: PAS domain S-box protein [Pyrinomonadaceae bacterium]
MANTSHQPFPADKWLIAIVESSRDAIISKDLNGIIQSWNKGAELIFGYTAEEAVGMPVTMLMPPERVDEEPGILARIRRGESIEHYETIRKRKDGTLIDISLAVSPIVDANGTVVGASKIARDISDRKTNLAELAKHASIVESASDAIISKDLNGIIQSWNQGAEAIFGYTAEEIIGKPVTVLMPLDRVDEEPGILARIRSGEAVTHYETIRRRKDGQLIDISLNVSPVRDAHGVIIGASKIAREITEHKRIQSAIRESEIMHRLVETQEAERARIARDLHDHIGQMLTGLRLKVERLLDMLPDDEHAKNQVLSIREIAARMDRDVGFLSRELRPSELDRFGVYNAIGAFVKDWSNQFGIDAEFKAVKTSANGNGKLPPEVETNLYRITQEALNNVVKHADAGHVSVLLNKEPKSVALVVEDDGCGFDADRPRDPRGSHGLGIIGMRERTELLGGSFEVESGDTGTSILVRIPLDENKNASHQA